jgi:two-component system, chemotaxis family, chemotaxis protein CheY
MQPKLLVIDDDLEFTAMLSEVCTAEGFTVTVSHAGRDGLVQALTQHPDVIISDFFMPEMSGLDLAKELRVDAWGKEVPIVLLTNMSRADISLDPSLNVECMLKTDSTLEDIAAKAKSLLAK